ncbi:MAG: hypothetical protein ACRDKB_01005 [Actinomycetota bacterium]
MKRSRVLIVVFMFIAACTGDDPARRDSPRSAGAASPRPTPTSSPTGPGTCAYGPWAEHCAAADWARAVIADAGYRLAGDTGSALVGRHRGLEFHFWAFIPEAWQKKPLRRALAEENYRPLHRSRVYCDGVRFAWSVHGLYVWLAASVGSLDQIANRVLDGLLRSSKRTPYEEEV